MVRLYLDDYTLSSALPDSFQIDQVDGEFVEVSITLEGQCIYTTKLYERNGIATFYELRQIVEQNMIARGLTLASFEVSVDYGDGGEEYEDKYIVFSRYRNVNDFNIDFLESHFLVNRTYYTIPRGKYASLPFFATEYEQFHPYYDCVFEQDGVIGNYRFNYNMTHFNRPRIYNISISPSYLKNQVDNQEGEDCGRLLSFTLHVGFRSMQVFVVDEEPVAQFYFRNSYNTQETMFVFGTMTFKTEISKKEAVSQNVISFYDKSVSRKWEVKTVPLTLEEAMWYNEFLESDDVSVDLSQEFMDVDILISDITSEISDSTKDQVHIKFSWKYNDNAYWINDER